MSEKLEFLTPRGRIVAGDVWKPQEKGADGKPLTIKTGPNAGQPQIKYYAALAIPKADPGLTALFATITQAALDGFPAIFDANKQCTNPQFAYKFNDGDSTVPNANGVKPCDREGWAGNYIFHFSTGFAPKRVTLGGEADIIDQSYLKRGDYCRIAGTVAGNGSKQPSTMGVFLNMSMVEFQQSGEAINTGPDPKTVFGGGAPGAANAAPPVPGTTVAPGAAPPPPGATAAAAPPPPAPAPHPDILNAPPSMDSRLSPALKAQSMTWQKMVDAGWNEDGAIQAGHLLPF